MITKEWLHQLVERLDAADVPMVERLLERLVETAGASSYTLLTAPSDDGPETSEECAAVAAARADVKAGRVVSHDDVQREFGV